MPGSRRPSRIQVSAKRAVGNRHVFPYLVAALAVLAVAAGFVVTLIDKRDFPTLGTGVWWAVVTLGTVGYGDVVPHTGWGRVVGSLVIVFGVTFIAFLTATVTSLFVEAEREDKDVAMREERAHEVEELRTLLQRLDARLEAIEAKLDRP